MPPENEQGSQLEYENGSSLQHNSLLRDLESGPKILENLIKNSQAYGAYLKDFGKISNNLIQVKTLMQ